MIIYCLNNTSLKHEFDNINYSDDPDPVVYHCAVCRVDNDKVRDIKS